MPGFGILRGLCHVELMCFLRILLVRLLDVLVKLLTAVFHCLEVAESLLELVLLLLDELLVLGNVLVSLVSASLESPDVLFGVEQLSLNPVFLCLSDWWPREKL